MLERSLRDLLSKQIELLEPGLKLLDVEHYIPSDIGTKSFIDLLARDTQGRWVLVELKRSDAAARQAIHEIYKYVEAVKRHVGARDDEIRAFIVSTEWCELLVPFSRFIEDTSISVHGMLLEFDDTETTLQKSDVTPIPISQGRLLSPWHELSLYKNVARLEEGISSYDASCTTKGVENYILVTLNAPPDHHEKSIRATAEAISKSKGTRPEDEVEDLRTRMDRMDHMIYFVPQLLAPEEYLQIIHDNSEEYEYAKETFDDESMGEEEKLKFLHEYAYDTEPRVFRDYLEIGNPAKFQTKLLDSEGWTITAIHRRGTFARNTLLSDETIIGEIGGDAGTSGQRLKRTVSLSNSAELGSIKLAIAECLPNNPVWQKSILSQLCEAKSDFPNGSVDISIFSPSTGVFTIFFSVTQEGGALYVPTYTLIVSDETGEAKRAYIGELEGDEQEEKNASAFIEMLNTYYEGNLGALILTSAWGYYEPRDLEILEDLGLVYSSYRCDLSDGQRLFFYQKNYRWIRSDPITPFGKFNDYLSLNEGLVRIVVGKIGSRYGAICDCRSAVVQLREFVENDAVRRDEQHSNPPEKCDICGVPFSFEPFFVDGKIKGHSASANMCGDCFLYNGEGIKWGIGQLFMKTFDGRWLLGSGLNPSE